MAKITRKKIRDRNTALHVEDPFSYVAQGLDTDNKDVWEEKPVDIQEFIESREFLNLKWDGKRGCRPKIMEIAWELTKDKVREAMLLLGKGSGKDYLSSILHLYGIYKCLCMYSPQQYYGLSPGSPIYFVNVARNENQARNVFFREFIGHLDNCAWMQDKFTDPGTQQVQFMNNVYALSGNSQAFGWLGYNVIQWVGDELAFFLEKLKADDENEAAESKAYECWEAAYGSCITRFEHHYKMIGITTPRFDDDFVMKKYGELERRMKKDGTAYVKQAATWDINPLQTMDGTYGHALAVNYRRTMRDFGAVPMGVIETFWGDPDFVTNNVCESCKQCEVYKTRDETENRYACVDNAECPVNPYRGNGAFDEWFVPDLDTHYYMHFDLSKNKDKTSFSMAHIQDWVKWELDPFEIEKMHDRDEKDISLLDDEDRFVDRPMMKIDFLGHIDPVMKRDPKLLKNGEIYYNGILQYIVFELQRRGFNIVLITVDSYQSHQFKQTIEDHGIETALLSLDRTDEVPVNAKKAFVENRVEYPYDRTLAREARHLKKGKIL